MLQRKPFLQLNTNWDGYPVPQHLSGLQNVPIKCLWTSRQKVNAKYGTHIENNRQRGKAHNGRIDHMREHSTRSLSGETAATLGMKTKRMLLQRDSKVKQVNRPNVMQKVSAFGPAHAEYARKLFNSEGRQCSNGYGDCLVPPFHPSVQGRHTLVSNREQTLIRTTRSHLPQGHVSDLHEPHYRRPTLKIAMITPRPDCKIENKPRNSASADGYAREGVREKNSLYSMEKVSENGSCPTILQLLCEISDPI